MKFKDILVRHWIKFDYSIENLYKKNGKFHLFDIQNSIHYKSLITNEYSTYEKLIKTSNQKEHSVSNFKKLIKEFDISLLSLEENKIILEWNEKLNKYIALDGCHRLAILMYNGLCSHDEVDPSWVLIKQKNNKNKLKNDTLEDKIKYELKKTTNIKHYNGWSNRTEYGYHSYNIKDTNIKGQRNPKMRLHEFNKFVDFKNKNIIDFGCNVGAMLHHLPEVKEGIGFDYDKNCIRAANNISKLLKYSNQQFFTHDFDKDSFDILRKKITFNPDIIFLLSLGSWIQTWEKLYSFCLDYSDVFIFLEINNEDEGKKQLDFFYDKKITPELIIESSLDDITNNRRKTYLIKNKKMCS